MKKIIGIVFLLCCGISSYFITKELLGMIFVEDVIIYPESTASVTLYTSTDENNLLDISADIWFYDLIDDSTLKLELTIFNCQREPVWHQEYNEVIVPEFDFFEQSFYENDISLYAGTYYVQLKLKRQSDLYDEYNNLNTYPTFTNDTKIIRIN